MWKLPVRTSRPVNAPSFAKIATNRRGFHDYFVTHLPSSSLHPDAKSVGPRHGLPRDRSTPHDPNDTSRSPAAPPTVGVGVSRELTVVRIPLKSAKHHFGVSFSRGQRPYNEDTFQAGTIEIPAFAKRQPLSLTRKRAADGVATAAQGASGDPQVFYFAVFDGHGGSECSEFLRDELHEYIEKGAKDFELESTLKRKKGEVWQFGQSKLNSKAEQNRSYSTEAATAQKPQNIPPTEAFPPPDLDAGEQAPTGGGSQMWPPDPSATIIQTDKVFKAEELERSIVRAWQTLVGGYFRRFKPDYFSTSAGGKGYILEEDISSSMRDALGDSPRGVGIETVLEYSFLKADYDFVSAQVAKPEDDRDSDHPINAHDILDKPSRIHKRIGGPTRFKGGSTCSIALISTPTPMPFWHPASPSTLITSHVGDTRILLCDTATGLAIPTTSNHHPSHPREAERMRRYAATFVTDSFGEERVLGLANTRAFGDLSSKRIGVSAEPEIVRTELAPAQYSFLVLVSDGVSGQLSDQEVVDIVKEAKTPEQGAKDVVNFATEVTTEGDNATALVVRLGGWERRSEGGLGSMGTKELRDWRRQEALDPRSRHR